VDVLHEIAHDYGRRIGDAALASGNHRPVDAESALELAAAVLADHGYQPRRIEAEMHLDNCPFHALAQQQTELACGMNHALICGVARALAPHSPHARLEPQPEKCCVVLTPCG
jgi:predicted ArsR family transcriptional regulator